MCTAFVACESCEKWFHIRCQNLTKLNLAVLSDAISCEYHCLGCTYKKGKFDFDQSLKRLSKYATLGVLKDGIKVEQLLMRKANLEPLSERMDVDFRVDYVVDKVSTQILESVCAQIPGKLPIHVTGDGNCLFNSISVSLFGHENLASELRVRTCIELNENMTKYEQNFNNLIFVSPDIANDCVDIAHNYKFSYVWCLLAATSVIGIPIQSVYPPKNGILDKTQSLLNQTFFPLGSKSSKKEPIQILWTRTTKSQDKTWLPNHFVPLLSKSDICD